MTFEFKREEPINLSQALADSQSWSVDVFLDNGEAHTFRVLGDPEPSIDRIVQFGYNCWHEYLADPERQLFVRYPPHRIRLITWHVGEIE